MDENKQGLELKGVGRDLRIAREAIGKQIKDAAHTLRIGAYHLEALEAGRYDDLPEPVYVHGFVRSYAGYLSLDADEMVRRVREELLPPILPDELHFPAASQDSPKPNRILLWVALILAAGVAGFWYLNMGSQNAPAPEPAVAAPKAEAETAPAITPSPAPAEASAAPAEAAPVAPAPAMADEAESEAPQIPSVDELTGQGAAAATAQDGAAAAQSEAGAQMQAPAPQIAALNAAEDAAPAPATDNMVAILAEDVGTPEFARPAGLAALAAIGQNGQNGTAEKTFELGSSPPLTIDTAPADAAVTAALPAPIAPVQPETLAAPAQTLPEASGAPQPGQLVLKPPAPPQELPQAPVVLRASSDTWMQISQPNGVVLKSWVMRAGEHYVPPADQTGLTALVGNAGALTIYLNGAEMPPLGAKGVVARAVPLDVTGLKSRFGG